MAMDICDSGDTMKLKLLKIHEKAEEALTKMQHLANLLQNEDNVNEFESGENEYRIRSKSEVQIWPNSSDSQLSNCRLLTEERVHDEAHVTPFLPKDDFAVHLEDGGSSGDERTARAAEDESDRKSINSASSLFNMPHRAWEVDIFLKDAELSIEKRMEYDGSPLIDAWIGDLKAQRLKLIHTQQETAMKGRQGIEAVQKVLQTLVEIEAAFSLSQKREPITLDALASVKEELARMQDRFQKCAVEKHALSLQISRDHEIRAEENKKLNEAVDSLIVRHKGEVSLLRLEIVRMKNSNERIVTALKDELKSMIDTRIPKEQYRQLEKENKHIRVAAEDAHKHSLAAALALSVERESRIQEMQKNDQNELRAQQNISLWQKRCRQLDSSLRTVMTAYERANLDWPFDEHFQIIDSSKDPKVAVALPPTPAMLAIAAEQQSARNFLFELEKENGELHVENERLHANYAASIVQNDEDRLKIDTLNAEIKKILAEKEIAQKKVKSTLAIASAKTKAATPKIEPIVPQSLSVESQTEELELEGNELKEFQDNKRLQSVAGLMLNQLVSRSEVNKILQQSVEDAASGLSKSLIQGEFVKHDMLQFMARMQTVLESLVHQNTQLQKNAVGERSMLLKRLQQALSSNDNMRREIDYLKCMSSNVFCENNEDDPTLGPLMHQHSVSIQTETEVVQITNAAQSFVDGGNTQNSSNYNVPVGRPVIPSRKQIMGTEMMRMRCAMMAWMASAASKTFFAWKNVVWFGASVQRPQLDAITATVEMQKGGEFFAQQFTSVVADVESICRKWSSTLSSVAGIISKEKSVKDLGDKFFSNRNQIQSMLALSDHTTSLQYQNAFQTLQEDLMDDHKEILLSARRSEEILIDLKNENVCLKTQNMELMQDSDGLTRLVEDLKQKLADEEARQFEWCTHVEATADVWAHQLLKLVEQGKALFEQNDALRKLLIESMGQVKSPLPKLIVFEHLSFDVGASNLCNCHGCKRIMKRLQVVRSAALNVSAKFSSRKQAMFKGADAFMKGKDIKEESNLKITTQSISKGPQKVDDVILTQDDHVEETLVSNGAQRTMLRVLNYQMKFSKLKSECAKLQGKIDELQLLNDYLRSKLLNQDDRNLERPGTAESLGPKQGNKSFPNSRQTTPRIVSHATPVNNSSSEDSLVTAESSSLTIQSLKSAHEILWASQNPKQHSVPRLIKSAGNEKHHVDDTSTSQTQKLDFMLDAAHRTIDNMHREIMKLREQIQANDKNSVADMIERATKLTNLKMMIQVEQLIQQVSELQKESKEKEKQVLLNKQIIAADFEARQLLLSQQLSSARLEMSRRAVKTIELRHNFEVAVAKSKSMEAALKSAERSKEDDRKIMQELNNEISQLKIATAKKSEPTQDGGRRIRDDGAIGERQMMSTSERERELCGQLLASEHIADAAVTLFHDLVKVMTEIHGNGNSIQVTSTEAFKTAKILGIKLPFSNKSPGQKEPNLQAEPMDAIISSETQEVCERKLPQVHREPMHRSDNALTLLKLVDSDFEDMKLVKSAMRRTQLRPFDTVEQQSPRNPIFARVLRIPKHPHNNMASKPHPPRLYVREAPSL